MRILIYFNLFCPVSQIFLCLVLVSFSAEDATPTPPAPRVAPDVAAVSMGVGHIGITWSVSSDGSDDVSDISYNIYRDGTLLDFGKMAI